MVERLLSIGEAVVPKNKSDCTVSTQRKIKIVFKLTKSLIYIKNLLVIFQTIRVTRAVFLLSG